jgi:hypothetical protein
MTSLVNNLVDKYLKLAKVAHFTGSGAETKALQRIAIVLSSTDPVTDLLECKTEAERDLLQKPHLAEYYVHKIKWYDQALAELLGE